MASHNMRKVSNEGIGYSVVDLNDVRHVFATAVPRCGQTVREQADEVVGRVDGNFMGAGHADTWVAEHADEMLDRVFVGQRVAALQHADVGARVGEEHIDGRGLALPLGLHEEPDLGMAGRVGLSNGDRLVGAAAGDDDNFDDIDFAQVLGQQRIQQPPDVGLLVIGRHAYAALYDRVALLQPCASVWCACCARALEFWRGKANDACLSRSERSRQAVIIAAFAR